MDGQSLLGDNLPPDRLIFTLSGRGFPRKTLIGELITVFDRERFGPPFYQFSEVSVVQCQNWYRIDLTSLAMTGGTVNDYVGPCPIHQLDSAETIRARVGELLTAYGYRLPDGW